MTWGCMALKYDSKTNSGYCELYKQNAFAEADSLKSRPVKEFWMQYGYLNQVEYEAYVAAQKILNLSYGYYTQAEVDAISDADLESKLEILPNEADLWEVDQTTEKWAYLFDQS